MDKTLIRWGTKNVSGFSFKRFGLLMNTSNRFEKSSGACLTVFPWDCFIQKIAITPAKSDGDFLMGERISKSRFRKCTSSCCCLLRVLLEES